MKQFILLFLVIILISNSNVNADKLYSWGSNDYGQLGDGTNNAQYTPVQIGVDTNWTKIVCGQQHSFALKNDNSLWVWGYNAYGQLGDGTKTDKNSPVQINEDKDWLKFACGSLHSVAIKKDGTLWAWGNNEFGQLGDGTTEDKIIPVQIGTETNWSQIACGDWHTIAIKNDGTLWAWGKNSYGQLGDETTTDKLFPVQIGTASNWAQITCGQYHSLAIKSGGTLWAWGLNDFGQLGDGTRSERHIPIRITLIDNWMQLASTGSSSHTAVIRSDNTLWAWGNNSFGQIGDGTTVERHTPVQIGSANNWKQVVRGWGHTVAIKSDGSLWSWGWNNSGELGDGTTIERHSPNKIGTGTNWTQVASGAYYSLALKPYCDSIIAVPNSIDFGNRTCLMDTTITIKISNLMILPVQISQISFYLGSNSKLTVSNRDATTISGNGTLQLSIKVKPNSTGTISDTLFIVYPNGCDSPLKIPINAVKDSIDFSLEPSDTLNLGRTCPNVSLETLIQVKNKSSKATTLIKNTLKNPFSIKGTDPFSSIFALNETKDLHIKFISSDTGIFYQTLIITDTCGNTKKIVLKAEIHVPQAEAGTNQIICQNDIIPIGITAQGGTPPYIYKWSPSSGLSNTNNAFTDASPKVTTKYYLTVTDSIGCTSIDSVIISVNPLPKPTISGANIICENQSYIYTTTTPPGTQSNWYITGAASVDSSRKDTVIIFWGKSGTGRIKLLQTITSTGCQDSIVENLDIISLPKPAILGKSSSCNNSIQKYYTTHTPGITNSWFVNGGYIIGNSKNDTVNVIWTNEGMVNINLIQTNESGCIDSVESYIKVSPSPLINLEDNISICQDSSYTLKPVVISGTMPLTNIRWAPSLGLNDPTILHPVISNLNPGNYKYFLTVTDINGCLCTDSININVRPQTELTLSRVILDFGSIDPCMSSKEDSLEVSNMGMENIRIEKCNINSGFSIVSPNIPFILRPNEKRTIVVRYTAISIGQISSNIIFTGYPCNWTKILPCTANKSEIYLSSSLTEVNFGQSLICTNISKDTIITLTNTSQSEITLDFKSINLESPFSIISPKTNQIIASKGTVNVAVHYEPKNSGSYSEDIKIPFNAGACQDTLKLALSGIIVAPKISFDKNNIVFPDISGCENSRDTIITFQNTGTIDVTFSGIEPVDVFSTTSNFNTILAGEKQDISIRFSPKNTGTYKGNLIIKIEPCGILDTINVSGNKQGVVFNVIDSLDFGEIVVCNDISKTLQLKIDNLSSGGLNGMIKSLVHISSPFNTNLKTGDSLLNGDQNLFDISANINSSMPDGEITGTLDFILSPCDSMKSVKLRAKKTSVTLTNPSILNFGQVNIGISKIDSIIIKNSGTSETVIGTIDNIILPFELISTTPKLPATLKPNDELTVRIGYTPNDELNDTLTTIVKAEPCSITKNIALLGFTSASSDAAVMQSGNKEGYSGDIIEVPIFLNNQIILQTAGITGLKTDLSFNSTILLPLDFIALKNDETTSKITLDSLMFTKSLGDTLTKVRFKVGLGNADFSDLTLSNVEILGGSANISIQNGKFKLLGVCPEGGKRLINPNGKIQITSVKPNPAEDNIEVEVELLELSGYKLLIFNGSGQSIREISCTNNKIGINSINIDISDLSSGVYNLILQTDSERISKMFLILK